MGRDAARTHIGTGYWVLNNTSKGRPEGKSHKFDCDVKFTGPALNIPWGLNIDGNDDVWFGNMWARSVVLMAGDDTKGHPAGTKAGDIIHVFQSGSIQMITDTSIDPAGNVWAANKWNLVEATTAKNPARPPSTWGGGSGSTVIYGVSSRCSRRAWAR